MKATFTYNLPDEQNDYDAARQGMSIYCLLQDYDNWLRGEVKYASPTLEREAILEEVRDKLHSLLEEEGIELYR